jgi:tRNA-dihydrouridine synthase B
LLQGKAKPAPPTAAERFLLALEHAQLALRLQGDSRKTVIEFRKHLGWYTKGLPGAASLRERLFQVDTMADAARIFHEYLEPVATAA